MTKFYCFRRVLPLLTLLFFSISSAWAEEVQIYLNEGATGTVGGITADGNVNTNEKNGNPGNSFANTTSSNTTFTFSGFNVSSYSDLKLVLDAKWAQFPATTNTYPSVTVKAYKNNVEVFSDATTIAVNSKVTTYNEYTVNITADFDKIVLTSNPSEGKTNKGAASTVYSLYMDNIKVLGTQSAPTKTLSSISVKIAPTKVTYTEGEMFNPAGLIITADYGTDGKEDVNYSGNESKFTFSPSTATALTTLNSSVTINFGGKSTNQSITVNPIPSHDAKFFVNGQQLGTTQSVKEGSAITFPASNPADIDDKKFMGWAEATIDGTTNTAPTFVTSATMGSSDKNFYAVFAAVEGTSETTTTTYTLNGNWTTDNGNWTKTAGNNLSSTLASGKYGLDSGSSTATSPVSYTGISKVVITGSKSGSGSGTWTVQYGSGSTWTDLLSSSNSKSVANSATWTPSSPVDGSLKVVFTRSKGNVYIASIAVTCTTAPTISDYCTSFAVKTLVGISVKTAPTKVTYTEEEMFDPAGLVITATYDDESTEDIAYADNAAAFTFSPALTTALATADESVTITYKEKNTTQTITVNAIPTYTLTITQPTEGGTLTVKNGDVTLSTGATVRVGTNLTCEVTAIPEGKRFSRFYAKWGEGNGESKYKQTNPATFDNIATENITSCEIYVTYKDIQYYTINYMINGVNTDPQEKLEEKSALTFPTAPATIAGKYFIGWAEDEIDGTIAEEPTLVNTSTLTATETKTYYAVYAARGEGGAATYTKATSLAVDDKVVFGLGEADGKPAQAVTGANSGATISATESEWIVYTAVEYPEKGIVLQLPNGDYQRTSRGAFDFTPDNPSTMSTNANSHVIGFGSFTLYNTPSNGNKFYSSKGDGYVEFLMWKVEGGVSYSDYCTSIKYTRSVTAGNYGTICLPYAVAADAHEGITFYNVAGVQKSGEVITGVVFEEETGNLVAGKPYVLKAAEAGTMSLPLTGAATGLQPATGLVGNLGERAEIEYDGSNTALYILSSNQLRKVVCTGVYVGQNKAYFDLSDVDVYTPQQAAAPGRISLSVEGYNTATGIDTLAGSATDSQKFLKDGQLFILRNGVLYNALGQVVK